MSKSFLIEHLNVYAHAHMNLSSCLSKEQFESTELFL